MQLAAAAQPHRHRQRRASTAAWCGTASSMSGAVLCPRPLVERLKLALKDAQLQDRFVVIPLPTAGGSEEPRRVGVLVRALAARAFAHHAATLGAAAEGGSHLAPNCENEGGSGSLAAPNPVLLGAPVLPAAIVELLRAGTITWAPEWRQEGAPAPHQARSEGGVAGEEDVDGPVRFRFVELFAGIGTSVHSVLAPH
jgi:hypothetical protein